MMASFPADYIHLRRDPAHWAFELTVGVIIDALLYALLWPSVRRRIGRRGRPHDAAVVHRRGHGAATDGADERSGQLLSRRHDDDRGRCWADDRLAR